LLFIVPLAHKHVAVDAPFAMPPIAVPDFAECPRFPIDTLGASSTDSTATTKAIAAAIDRAHNAGGGIIVIPPGCWATGKVHLKSNVNLHLEEGATLLFSADPSDYLPPVQTSWEGFECFNYSPLVYAFDCENVAVTGRGTLRAQLDTWQVWYGRPPAHMEGLKRLYELASTDVPVDQRQMVGEDANLRPQFIQFNRCRHVLLESIRIEQSPFWVIHPLLCSDVVIRGVHVIAHGHNNDGVDPEMSRNVLIEDCVFDQGDDAIAVKAGRNRDAWRIGVPMKNLVIRRCRIRHAHQLLAIGTELSAGVENVLMEDCQLDPAIDNVGHLLLIKTNERRGGYVSNVYFRNITAGDVRQGVLGIETDVLYQWRDIVKTYETRLTEICGIHLENVRVGRAEFLVNIEGQADQPVRDVTLRDVTAAEAGDEPIRLRHVDGFEASPGGAETGRSG
jgi:polygalacturonase